MRTPSLFGMPFVLQSLTSCSSSRYTAPSMSRSVVCKSTWWHPTFAPRVPQAPTTPTKSLHSERRDEVDEPTPVWPSHLSGMGDSDSAECARRIARLSLRLVCPYSYELRLSGSTVPVATAYFSQSSNSVNTRGLSRYRVVRHIRTDYT